MIIMKFGGTSLKNSSLIKNAAQIIKGYLSQKPVIVFSAIGDITDRLSSCGARAAKEGIIDTTPIERLHRKIVSELGISPAEVDVLLTQLKGLLKGISLIKELSGRTKDLLISFGERLSVRIISAYLNKIGIAAKYFDAWDIGLITDSAFQNASVLPESYKIIRDKLARFNKKYAFTPVITGFIGKDKKGNITTLGRGGSDLTASILGKAVAAKEVQVWKDVDGLMTTDPKFVKSAKLVKEISFEEASELAYFGAKILHPRSVLPAMEKNIPVRVKNSRKPGEAGTLIKKSSPSDKLVKVITFQENLTVIDIVSTRMLGLAGYLAKVFNVFEKHEISVDMIASSEVSISLTLNKDPNSEKNLDKLANELSEFSTVSVSKNKAMVTVIGNVKKSSAILKTVFDAMVENKINVQMISQGSSKVNISFIIDENQLKRAVPALHAAFF